jgi:hypothetical protein
MKNKTIYILLLICLLFSLNIVSNAQEKIKSSKSKSGKVTLLAQNANHQAFCFRDAEFVKFTDNTKVTNDCPDIIFNFFNKNSFDAAYSAVNYSGRLENLGSFDEIRRKYKISNDLNDESLFDSIKLNENNKIILNDPISESIQIIRESDRIFRGAEFHYADVKDKHIYIVRYTDDINFSFQRIVKFVVTDFKTNEYVTIKWENLFDNQIYNN